MTLTQLCTLTTPFSLPLVQLVNIDEGFLSLMADDGETKDDIRLPGKLFNLVWSS